MIVFPDSETLLLLGIPLSKKHLTQKIVFPLKKIPFITYFFKFR